MSRDTVHRCLGTSFTFPELERRVPIFFSGGSEPARQIAADHADAYLVFAGPIDDVRQEVEHMRRLVPGGRRLRIGLRVNVIVRDTEREAWRAADTLISKADPEIASLVAERSRSSSPSRLAHHRLTSRASLTVGPNLWAGVGTVRFGVAVSLVGDPGQIVERLMEYRAAGSTSSF